MDGLLHDLQNHIDGDVRFDDISRMLYSTDASIYQIEPIGVVIPRHADDVVAGATAAWHQPSRADRGQGPRHRRIAAHEPGVGAEYR